MSASHAGHHEGGFISKYIFSTDHKTIGMQYMILGIIMALVGGFLAYKFRMHLAFPNDGHLLPKDYNSYISAHGAIMIFWVAMPVLVAAFGNFLIPTMIGCDDMAYPTLNMLSFWVFLLSAVVLIVAMLVGGYGGGWTLYPPLSANMPTNVGGGYGGELPGILSGGSLFIVAVALEFIAFLIGGLNFLVTTINMRAPGMGFWDIPFVVWMIDLAVVIFMFSVGPLVAGALMLLFDRVFGTGFYDPAKGGDPVLFQHLFWFFGHPEVYVILLPSMGIVGEILPTFARKPLFGYKKMIYAAMIASFLSFIVWAHHQFIAGINPQIAIWFTVGTILISVPFASMMLSFVATVWKGSVEMRPPMLWALGWFVTFMIGGVTGLFLGAVATDIHFHDTTFVVAHFHFTLVPITLFGALAGIYYWFPKFIGKMYNEFLAKLHFWFSMIFFVGAFGPLFMPGVAGQHRRIAGYTEDFYPQLAHFQDIRIISTVCVIGLIVVQLIFFYNMFISITSGEKADRNPWKANTLEWTCPSPPPHGNFEEFPTVYRGPYEYSVPNREADYWPQNEPS